MCSTSQPYSLTVQPNEMTFTSKVLGEVRRLRRGEVVTYSEIARRVDRPWAARAVGQVLAHSHAENVPWWLVVTVHGDLFAARRTEHSLLLREDGIELVDGRVPRRLLNAPEARTETEGMIC